MIARKKLGELVDYRKGFAFKSSLFQKVGPVGVVKATNFTGDSIDLTTISFVSEKTFNQYIENQIVEHDVIIQTVGSWPTNPESVVGKVIRVPHSDLPLLLNQNTVRLRGVGIHQGFLYYSLRCKAFKDFIVGKAQGAANQASITLESIFDFELVLPDFPVQERISSILQKYDSLIAINSQRIEILKKMSQLHYQEWFVNFKPNATKGVSMIDSGHPDFGMIPEGWKISRFGEVFDCRYGKNLPKTEISVEGEFPVYGAGGVIGRYRESNSPHKTALITSRGNGSGDLSLTDGPAFVTNNSFLVSGKNQQAFWDCSFVFHHLHSVNVKQALGGAAQPQLTLDGMANLPALVPSPEVVRNFQAIASAQFNLIDSLNRQSKRLVEIRDLLLPRLISGEIDVSVVRLDDVSDNASIQLNDQGSSERLRT